MTLGVCLTGALALKSSQTAITLQALVLTLSWLTTILLTKNGSRVHLLANYLAAWALYAGSTSVVLALKLPLQHARLLEWDTHMLGGTPSAMMQGYTTPWMNDVLSLGYMSYHIYLHWALIDSMFQSSIWRRDIGKIIFTAFALGFPGYYLFPSAPPAIAFPELFHGAIAGGWLTRLNESIDAQLAAHYDAFPSLHVLVTLALLTCDWRVKRFRFWTMLLPSVLMIGATLVLRIHFAVDLLAAAALYLILLIVIRFTHATNPDHTDRTSDT